MSTNEEMPEVEGVAEATDSPDPASSAEPVEAAEPAPSEEAEAVEEAPSADELLGKVKEILSLSQSAHIKVARIEQLLR